MKLFGKKDMAVILAALALCGLGLLALHSTGGATVKVYLDGELYCEQSLEKQGDIRVEQQDGSVNVVRIADGCVHMHSSTCKNQLCVQQGMLCPGDVDGGAGAGWIICLPNRVTVEISN